MPAHATRRTSKTKHPPASHAIRHHAIHQISTRYRSVHRLLPPPPRSRATTHPTPVLLSLYLPVLPPEATQYLPYYTCEEAIMTMADVTNEMTTGAQETQTTEKPQAKPDSLGVSTSATSLNDSFTIDSDAIDAEEIFNSNQRRRSIQFGQVLIRTHGQALGDNPSCSRGPALSLDWPYNEGDPVSIDDYEDWAKDNRRSKTEILVPYTARREILFTYGYSISDINAGIKNVNKAKKQRRASLDTSPSLMGTLKTKFSRRKSA